MSAFVVNLSFCIVEECVSALVMNLNQCARGESEPLRRSRLCSLQGLKCSKSRGKEHSRPQKFFLMNSDVLLCCHMVGRALCRVGYGQNRFAKSAVRDVSDVLCVAEFVHRGMHTCVWQIFQSETHT